MMTEVNQEVIDDLMPLYLAGEASPATRRMVEQFLELHPGSRPAQADWELPSPLPPPDLDRRMLDRARQLHERRNLLFGAALACSYAVFSFRGRNRDIVFVLYRDTPWLAWVLLGLALLLWLMFLSSSRQLERTGLPGAPRSPAARGGWMAGGAAALLPYAFVASHQTGWELTPSFVVVGAFTGIALGVALGRVTRS